MSGTPVVVVPSGGLPVTPVSSGAPLMTVVDSGAAPITLAQNSAPFVLRNPDGTPYIPNEALFFADLINGIYYRTAQPSCVRASPAYAPNLAGVYQSFSNNQLRLTDAGLYVPEPMFTEIGNYATMAGATLGVLGSGGSLPTGWTQTAVASGVTVEVVAIGTNRGLPTIDVRFSGTPSSNWRVRPSGPSALLVSPDTPYAISSFLALVAGVVPNDVAVQVGAIWFQADNAFITASLTSVGASLTSALDRKTTISDSPANAGRANIDIFSVTTGTPIDFTLRFAAPNMGIGTAASSLVLSNGVPSIRAAETITPPIPSGTYDLHLLLDDASEEVIPGFQNGDALPLTLPQGKFITSYWGMPA